MLYLSHPILCDKPEIRINQVLAFATTSSALSIQDSKGYVLGSNCLPGLHLPQFHCHGVPELLGDAQPLGYTASTRHMPLTRGDPRIKCRGTISQLTYITYFNHEHTLRAVSVRRHHTGSWGQKYEKDTLPDRSALESMKQHQLHVQ